MSSLATVAGGSDGACYGADWNSDSLPAQVTVATIPLLVYKCVSSPDSLQSDTETFYN